MLDGLVKIFLQKQEPDKNGQLLKVVPPSYASEANEEVSVALKISKGVPILAEKVDSYQQNAAVYGIKAAARYF